MKIAHIICVYPPYRGGMGNSAQAFVKELVALKHEVTVLTPAYKTASSVVDENGVRVERIKPVWSFGNAAVLPKLFRRLKEFDVVHLHYPFYGTAIIVAIARLFGGFKLVIHYHMDSTADNWRGWFFKIYAWTLAPMILRIADAITCASLDYVKHGALARFYNKHSEHFLRVPFGVDSKLFCPSVEIKQKRLLFVGGLDDAHYFKGVDVLLTAFASLGERVEAYRLAIIGDGNLLPAYRQLAADLKIDNRVDFINNASDVELAKIYRESTALILPSINRCEAFGLVLLEAMASGLPVIASNLPGVRSVFKNNRQGLLIEPGNVEDLAKKIWQLVSQEKQTITMGLASRQLVEEQYTWAMAGKKLNELYLRLKYSPKVL